MMFRRTVLAWTVLLVTILISAGPLARATVYYVAPSGDDANPGTPDQPWRSLQMASATMLPGDTVLIADGDYAGGVQQTTSGTPDAPITFQAVHPGGPVVWGDQTQNIDTFWMNRCDWIVVDGLTIRNAIRDGVRVDNANHCTVRRCTVLDSMTTGIFTNYSDDTTIEYNECAFSQGQHGIYVSNSGDRPIVRYNVCHDNPHAGIQLNGDGKQTNPDLGARGDGIIQDGQIIGNVIYNNGLTDAAAGLNLLCVCSTLVADNLIYNNLAGGIALGNDNLASATQFGSKDNRILHNTIYFRPTEGRWCISATHGSTGNVIMDNILAGGAHGAYQLDHLSSIVADYNLMPTAGTGGVVVFEDTFDWYWLLEWQALSGNDLHSSMADPGFVSPGAEPFDFHLQSWSPAIGAGVPMADVTIDLDGSPRAQDGPADLGCYVAGAVSTYTISGHVTAGGVGVASVLVSAGGQLTTTTLDGSYSISGLAAGTYAVKAVHPSYEIAQIPPVTVGPSQTDVDFEATGIVSDVSVNPSRVLGGTIVAGSVTVAVPAPPGGTVVSLSASSPEAQIPDAVTVHEGMTTASFTIATAGVSADTHITITASLGLGAASCVLTITPTGVASVSVSPNSVTGGTATTGLVRLTGPAPAGGAVVVLSSGAAEATPPAQVIVPAGLLEASFPIQTGPVAADKIISITARLGNSSYTTSMKIVPPVLTGAWFDPESVTGGSAADLWVSLSGPAPASGMAVKLSMPKSSAATLPATLTVPAGESQGRATVLTSAVPVNTTVTATATLGKSSYSAPLTIVIPVLTDLSVGPSDIVAGTPATGTVRLNGPASSKNVTVLLSSSNPVLAKVSAKVVVRAGNSTANFAITTKRPKGGVGLPAQVSITATLNSVTQSVTVTLR